MVSMNFENCDNGVFCWKDLTFSNYVDTDDIIARMSKSETL